MIVVVGGGPAGLAAATMLARAGRPVVLHEAGTFPRHRVCGEFLSPDARAPLAALGLAELPARLGATEIDAARVTTSRGGRVRADTSFALGARGHGLARLDLDMALADHARREGVDIRDRSRLAKLPLADTVVVATGRLARPGDDARTADADSWVGVKVHVRGLPLGGVVELHCIESAYVGLNEVACAGERVTNVCALVRREAWEQAGLAPWQLWELLAADSPAFGQRWRSAEPVEGTEVSTAGFGFRSRGAVVSAHALAVGDAAAVAAPLAGVGQALALQAGVAAARVILGDPRDPSSAWRRRFLTEFWRRIVVGKALQRTLLSPVAAGSAVKLVRTVGASSLLFRSARGPG